MHQINLFIANLNFEFCEANPKLNEKDIIYYLSTIVFVTAAKIR